MDNPSELLQKAALSLEKYRKNRSLVSPEDLAGKYKAPFENLKRQLAGELSEYLKAYVLEDISEFYEEYAEDLADSVNRIFTEYDFAVRCGKAVFQDMNMEAFKRLADELRSRVFRSRVCLYVTDECLREDSPQMPRIYNDLVDKFWDEERSQWIKDESPNGPAIKIYMSQEDETE